MENKKFFLAIFGSAMICLLIAFFMFSACKTSPTATMSIKDNQKDNKSEVTSQDNIKGEGKIGDENKPEETKGDEVKNTDTGNIKNDENPSMSSKLYSVLSSLFNIASSGDIKDEDYNEISSNITNNSEQISTPKSKNSTSNEKSNNGTYRYVFDEESKSLVPVLEDSDDKKNTSEEVKKLDNDEPLVTGNLFTPESYYE